MRIIVLLLLLIACNPVKQVLRDREKFNEIAQEVIRQGYCANDTITVTKSDTLVTTDTVNNIYIDTEYRNDTVYLTKNIRSIATKKIIIRDTIKKVVVDNARIKVLEADKVALRIEAMAWKDKAQDRLSWLILALIIIGLWLFFKFKP
jgi:cell division protein FtsI/penicillin-binding protein 2